MTSKEEKEKKYGKVIAVRLRPENAWIASAIEQDIKKTDDRGKPIVSGKSEFVEMILINYYAERRGLLGEKTEADHQLE